MEKRNQIIIVGLLIIILALLVGLVMTIGNNGSKEGSGADGMQKYDFNSVFTMSVPENAKFLKEWNSTSEFNFGEGYSYFDKNNEFAVSYWDSPLVTHGLVDAFVDVGNKSGNYSSELEGDLVICHNLKNDGGVGNSIEKSNFTEAILLEKGHQLIIVKGNDLEFIKSMVNTIEFYE